MRVRSSPCRFAPAPACVTVGGLEAAGLARFAPFPVVVAEDLDVGLQLLARNLGIDRLGLVLGARGNTGQQRENDKEDKEAGADAKHGVMIARAKQKNG